MWWSCTLSDIIWLEIYTPHKFKIDTQNGGLDNVSPLKHGSFGVSILNFRAVYIIIHLLTCASSTDTPPRPILLRFTIRLAMRLAASEFNSNVLVFVFVAPWCFWKPMIGWFCWWKTLSLLGTIVFLWQGAQVFFDTRLTSNGSLFELRIQICPWKGIIQIGSYSKD